MVAKKNHSQSFHQGIIVQILNSTIALSIKEICLLWVFKNKETLNAKQVEQLQFIANRNNNSPAIKSNKLTILGSANHG